MYTTKEPAKENKGREIIHRRSGEQAYSFVDNRPEATAQREFQDVVDSSAQANQTIQLQMMVDKTNPVQRFSTGVAASDVIQRVKTKVVAGTTVSTDDQGGYPQWDMPAGTTWHVNWNETVEKKGKTLYHVTREKSPKQHYFFTLEDGVVTSAVSGQKGKKKFSDLPQTVQTFVSTNINSLLP
jgi:hypothetical protein